jgi:branched-chain amino acid transport system permease protein
LVGIGAFTFSKVAAGGNPLGLVAAMAVTAGVGVLIALPALRLQGLYLALSTLAFAALADYVFFLQQISRSALQVPRLSLFGLSAEGQTANLVLLAAAFAVMGNLVLALRRGPFGRLLTAMRDSPAACATLGINLTVTKIALFALSGSMAAVGAVLWGGTKSLVTANDFVYLQSLVLLLIVTIAGVNTVSGAFVGGLLIAMPPIITPYIPERLQQITFLGTGFGALSLGREPNGIIGQVTGQVAMLRRRFQSSDPPAAKAADSGEVKAVAAPAG